MVQTPSPGDIQAPSPVGERFCACYFQALTKVPHAKSGMFGSLGPIPMIQPPFNSSYNTNFFPVVPSEKKKHHPPACYESHKMSQKPVILLSWPNATCT